MYAKLYGELEECTVHLSKTLANLCRPYVGDPRGACVAFEKIDSENLAKSIETILLKSGDKVLKGADGSFVCIPQAQYEQMLQSLNDL